MLVSGLVRVQRRVLFSKSSLSSFDILFYLAIDANNISYRRLVNSFPECGLGVALAVDGTLYQSDVYAASHGTTNLVRSTRRHGKSFWGHKPVLLLLGIRLGLDGVNPIYYSTIKVYRFCIYAYTRSIGF